MSLWRTTDIHKWRYKLDSYMIGKYFMFVNSLIIYSKQFD